jgi:hypothetical protein
MEVSIRVPHTPAGSVTGRRPRTYRVKCMLISDLRLTYRAGAEAKARIRAGGLSKESFKRRQGNAVQRTATLFLSVAVKHRVTTFYAQRMTIG